MNFAGLSVPNPGFGNFQIIALDDVVVGQALQTQGVPEMEAAHGVLPLTLMGCVLAILAQRRPHSGQRSLHSRKPQWSGSPPGFGRWDEGKFLRG